MKYPNSGLGAFLDISEIGELILKSIWHKMCINKEKDESENRNHRRTKFWFMQDLMKKIFRLLSCRVTRMLL